LPEAQLLARCTKCGHVHAHLPHRGDPAALTESGLEGLWTPVMDFRLSRGGCLKDCVACGHLCPTAAIRPLSLDESAGAGRFAKQGPLRIGTAFFDRSRCLPWAMDRPCIVCQEMCPVSPKAIFTRTEYQPVRGGLGTVVKYDQPLLKLSGVEPQTRAAFRAGIISSAWARWVFGYCGQRAGLAQAARQP
jgi:ferredoxin